MFRNIGSQLGAGFKSLVGGELKGMTKNAVAGQGRRLAAQDPGRTTRSSAMVLPPSTTMTCPVT